jgi:hypothetical protein
MSFHLYRITELYSNADGSVQFIELAVGNENGEGFWAGNAITDTKGGTIHSFTFPTDLPSEATANTTVLIATQGFADLGIVTPDFIIPAGFLFTNGGTVNYAGVDAVTYAQLPTDGLTALDRSGNTVTAIATDFAGVSAVLTTSNDYLAITRTALPLDEATTVANAIRAGMQTETQYVNGLLSQVADTTIPAVCVEGSMYGAVGSSAEITKLVTQFLPAQVANAILHGFNPQVYASEALGLVFAFGDENGGTAFATNFGPSSPTMPNSTAGDAAFAAAASTAIFGAASTPNLVNVLDSFVTNWKAFYTSNGIPGIPATAANVDLAARGAAWGDAVGVALANNLGPLPGQVINFLKDAAQGTAVYSASLASQPTPGPFQGGAATASAASAANDVQLTGVAAHVDHTIMWTQDV